ncbi:MAG TPA: cytochrome P450 [Solirubrobacteraceae bacterium]
MNELTASVTFDPIDMATHEDPYPAYRALRKDAPLYHNPEQGFWVLSRHADVIAADKDWETFTGKFGVDLDDTSNQFGDGVPPQGFFLGYDPPRHTLVRRAIRSDFLPDGLRQLEPMVRRKCDELVDRFIDRGAADIAEVFAISFPDLVFADVLGIPEAEHEKVSRLLRTALLRDIVNLPAPFIPAESLRAGAELREELKRIVMDRRSQAPRDDLIGKLVALSASGVSDEEIVGTVFFVFTAGTEEVTGLITNALHLLAGHPDQRAELIADPGLIPGAVEEVLRYETIVQHLVKSTTRPVELYDRVVPEGARVVLLYGSANRDERVFADPDRFDITRRERGLASFGAGIHTCLGAPLARLEARVALETLLPKLGDYQVSGDIEWSQRVNFRGLRRLPLAWS